MVFPQASNLIFEKVLLGPGNMEPTVLDLYQDKFGYVWIGTNWGLFKYDGYEIVHYKANYNELCDNNVYTIEEGVGYKIWVGTQNGLNLIDVPNDTVLQFKKGSEFGSLKAGSIWAILEYSSNKILLGTNKGLYTFAYPDNKFIQVKGTDKIFFQDFELDSGNNIWVGTLSGLFKLNTKTLGFNKVETGHDSLSIFKIHKKSNGNLLLSVNGGLVEYDPQNGISVQFNFPEPKANLIYGISRRTDTNFWLASIAGLIKWTDMKNYKIIRMLPIENYNTIENETYSILEDRSGVVWVGFRNGVFKLDKNFEHFEHYSKSLCGNSGLSANSVWAVLQDSNGNIWAGTNGGGLNKKTESGFIHLNRRNPQSPFMWDDKIQTLAEDPMKNLWIGTHNSGVYRYNLNTEDVDVFAKDTSNTVDSTTVNHNSILDILCDNSGNVWIGTNGKGLNKYNSNTQTFSYYTSSEFDPSSIDSDMINTIIEDKVGAIWVGTDYGLNKFNFREDNFLVFSKNSAVGEFKNRHIISLFCDSENRIWISTNGTGLSILSYDRETIKTYTTEDNLPSNVVYWVTEVKGDYWIATQGGLTMFDPINDDFINFGLSYEYKGVDYNQNAYFVDNENNIYFGALQGLFKFNPDSMQLDTILPRPSITNFIVRTKDGELDKLVQPITINDSSSIITLKSNENNITIKANAMHYRHPLRNHYKYRLIPRDSDWIENSRDNSVSFSALPSGDYIFELIASNSAGLWNEKPTSIRFTINSKISESVLKIADYGTNNPLTSSILTFVLSYLIFTLFMLISISKHGSNIISKNSVLEINAKLILKVPFLHWRIVFLGYKTRLNNYIQAKSVALAFFGIPARSSYGFECYADATGETLENSIIEKLQSTNVVYISGKVGSGKTTLLHHLCSNLLDKRTQLSNYLPIIVTPPYYHKDSIFSIYNVLRKRDGIVLHEEETTELLQTKRVLLVFDGISEYSGQRGEILNDILRLAENANYPNLKFLISSRSDMPSGFLYPSITLLPVDFNAVPTLLSTYESNSGKREKAIRTLEKIQINKISPLLIRMALHNVESKNIETKSDLYKNFFLTLLANKSRKDEWNEIALHYLLEELAFEAITNGTILKGLHHEEIINLLTPEEETKGKEGLLAKLNRLYGLKVIHGIDILKQLHEADILDHDRKAYLWKFHHDSFGDYFLACYFVRNLLSETVEHFAEKINLFFPSLDSNHPEFFQFFKEQIKLNDNALSKLSKTPLNASQKESLLYKSI